MEAEFRHFLQEIGVVVAVNKPEILQENLLRSPLFVAKQLDYISIEGASSASIAYNQGIEHYSDKKYIIFVHQDVYLPEESLYKLFRQLQTLQQESWAVAGVFGCTVNGERVGQVWDAGMNVELGKAFDSPIEVQSVDELFFVLNNRFKLTFDEQLPGFHLYGTDICVEAAAQGLKSYVVCAPLIHNSGKLRSLGGAYAESYRFMQQKWQHKLPLHTTCSAISPWGFQYKRIRFGLAYRRWLGLIPDTQANSVDAKSKAQTLGYETCV